MERSIMVCYLFVVVLVGNILVGTRRMTTPSPFPKDTVEAFHAKKFKILKRDSFFGRGW